MKKREERKRRKTHDKRAEYHAISEEEKTQGGRERHPGEKDKKTPHGDNEGDNNQQRKRKDPLYEERLNKRYRMFHKCYDTRGMYEYVHFIHAAISSSSSLSHSYTSNMQTIT